MSWTEVNLEEKYVDDLCRKHNVPTEEMFQVLGCPETHFNCIYLAHDWKITGFHMDTKKNGIVSAVEFSLIEGNKIGYSGWTIIDKVSKSYKDFIKKKKVPEKEMLQVLDCPL